MIPYHRPPFTLTESLRYFLSRPSTITAEVLEMLYAEAMGMPEAVLLPSARAGLYLVFQSVIDKKTVLVSPVYTCAVVHDAMKRTGASVHLLDITESGFLLDPAILETFHSPNFILVLGEIYGIRYPNNMFDFASVSQARLRIVDMAMSIPLSRNLEHLGKNDVALLSFGLGKCIYAGWGGMALLRDPELAEKIRFLRTQWVAKETMAFGIRNGILTLLRIIAYNRVFYGLAKRTIGWWHSAYDRFNPSISLKNERKNRRSSSTEPLCSEAGARSLSAEWTQPMSHFNRKLSKYNLHRIEHYVQHRLQQSQKYYNLLTSSTLIDGLHRDNLPQSHFPIRVPASNRDKVRKALWVRGVDTGTLFPFPENINPKSFPHAAKASEEVVTLPLGEQLLLEEVEMIADYVLKTSSLF